MQRFVGTSLKIRLYLIVLAAFAPVALLIFYVTEEQKAIEADAIFQKTMALAHAVANEENQQLNAARNLMTTIAESVLTAGGHEEHLSDLLARVAHQAAEYELIGITDPAGRLLAAGDPSTVGRIYGDMAWFAACVQQRRLTMGQYRGEHINGEPVLYLALPAIDAHQKLAAVVIAALNLNWMNRPVFKQLTELPDGSRLTFLGQGRDVLRYDVDDGQWSVPDGFDATLRERIASRQSGTLTAADENGVARIYAFTPLTSALRNRQIAVVLEIPRAVALKASTRIFTRNLALLTISGLIAVLSIWWAADRFILRRVHAMVRASRELAAGDLSARIGNIGAQDELSHLAGVFDDMAASLQLRIEREQQAMASLERSREQLRNLSAYQNGIREQERIRIAREIHDQLGQSLTILKMDLSWLKRHVPESPPTVEAKMAAMSGIIDEALDNLHAVTAELRPVILDDFGLAAAIEWQAEVFRNRSGVSCRFENNGFEPDLARDQATALFRIFQEILTNIMRHAGADDVIVRLERHGGELFLQVADNGRGITDDEINAPNAFGLLGIRERLHPLGGRVTFEGRPGQGTRVTIHLPLPPEGETP